MTEQIRSRPAPDAMEVPKIPKIFIFCEPDVTGTGDVISQAVAEDGVVLAHHISSNEEYAKHDMGMPPSDWKHEIYRKHYPGGYELEWFVWEDQRR